MIDWITFWGLIIFNTLVLTGDFERFKNWMVHHATADIRIQTIMLAWAFGALLEGLVGFGIPVGRGRADSGWPGNRGPRRHSRRGAGEQRAGFLRRAGRAHSGPGRRYRVCR